MRAHPEAEGGPPNWAETRVSDPAATSRAASMM